ncbi:cell envelope biogenesis protein OmpA [Blastomonas marina]|uniref:Cell envelope biogenesis protein OmpA n=1 Tax=Blastomonas marina TaxID=1867408 RepID=A0ABQ1FGZ7_9SPHN|nr:OmpA family protein [Blastomonas marina]GGA11670.1 cell envelope biogenesis protein OmpA [Blastomonas marina]
MKSHKFAIAAVCGMSLVTAGCITDPNTGEKTYSRTAVLGAGGALAGYLLGGLIGGKTARIVGAGIGGVAGGVVGNRIDQQIKELKEKTAGSGVDVTSDGESILVNLPDTVTFDVGSSTLKPSFRATLDEVAATLVDYPNSLIDVYGHTDSTGSDAFNQALSERRAKAVADYLIARNVDRRRIMTQGFGETQPIADNGTEAGRAQNRRVEIKIIPITEEDVAEAKAQQ